MTTNVSSGPTKYKFLLTDLEDEGRETGALGNERETGEQRGTGTKGELTGGKGEKLGQKGQTGKVGPKSLRNLKYKSKQSPKN